MRELTEQEKKVMLETWKDYARKHDVNTEAFEAFKYAFQASLDHQRAEVERLRAILKNISDKITDSNLDFAGPHGLIHVPLSREEIDAIRAALADKP